MKKEQKLEQLRSKNELAKKEVRKLKDTFSKQMLVQKKRKATLQDLEDKEDEKQGLIKEQIEKLENQNTSTVAEGKENKLKETAEESTSDEEEDDSNNKLDESKVKSDVKKVKSDSPKKSKPSKADKEKELRAALVEDVEAKSKLIENKKKDV